MTLETVDFDPVNRIMQVAIQNAAGQEAATSNAAVFQFDDMNLDIGQADDSIIRYGKKKHTQRKNLRSGFSGTSPWKYSGAAGTPSIMAILYRLSGMDVDITDPLKVTYTESPSINMDLATLRSFDDISPTESYLNKLVDSRAVLGFDFTAGQALKIKISILGDYFRPAVASTFVPDWGTQESNVGADIEAINIENDAVQLDGKDICLVSATTDNARRAKTGRPINTCPGNTALIFADGQWTLVIRTPHFVNDWNPWALYEENTLVPFKVGIGTVAGKRISIAYDEVQIGKITEGKDNEGLPTLSMPLSIESELTIVES